VVYVLDVFMKKSKSGIKTPLADIERRAAPIQGGEAAPR